MKIVIKEIIVIINNNNNNSNNNDCYHSPSISIVSISILLLLQHGKPSPK